MKKKENSSYFEIAYRLDIRKFCIRISLIFLIQVEDLEDIYFRFGYKGVCIKIFRCLEYFIYIKEFGLSVWVKSFKCEKYVGFLAICLAIGYGLYAVGLCGFNRVFSLQW